MAATVVIAASAVAASGIAQTAGSSLYPALLAFGGTIIGAGIAQGVGLYLWRENRRADARKDAIRRAFDSAGSHVAKVTFDKYVQFCEQYVPEWGVALETLFRLGPCKEATDHAHRIIRLRQQWILWVPPEVEETLKKYEDALMDIGTKAYLTYETKTSLGPKDGLGNQINDMYQRFAELSGFKEWQGEQLNDDLKAQKMMQQLRATLGTDSYNKLRSITMRLALNDLEEFEGESKQ